MKLEVKLTSPMETRQNYVKDPEALKGKAAVFFPSQNYEGSGVIIWLDLKWKEDAFSILRDLNIWPEIF